MSSMSNIDKMKFEKLLGMSGGYVLNFSNRSFAEFVKGSIGVNIYDDKYAYESGSKANRLRALWDREPDRQTGKLLSDLIEYWNTQSLLDGNHVTDAQKRLAAECESVACRLLGKPVQQPITEDQFLKREFDDLSIKALKLDSVITSILEQRLDEIKKCMNAKASLAVIFLAGSTLEGLLLSVASKNPRSFNQAAASPKDKQGKVLQLHEWSLKDFIDAACEIGLLGLDVKKFSHSLRDFRNYIHPYQQMVSRFDPDEHTARICWQVLRAAIADMSKRT